jgi:prepilin-type N-terminal cleavage/methylation domain-containing protein
MTFRRSRGFSLLEMMIVIAIGLTMAAITTVAWMPIAKQQHVTTAYNLTLTTLRHARDQAAADMRIYVVSFATPGTITVTQDSPTGTVLFTSVLPSDITFHVEPGVPTSPTVRPTTPDGFGTASSPFDFDESPGVGGGTTIYFYPDGTAQDNLGNVNNGVVYLGRPGDLYSSRAITLWGSTGRLRGWRLYLTSGVATWTQQ